MRENAMTFDGVASFLDAWIEINAVVLPLARSVASHPSWMRGLKLFVIILLVNMVILSHPSWMRGLKFLDLLILLPVILVASFLDAWIEIFVPTRILWDNWVASFLDAWIEIC